MGAGWRDILAAAGGENVMLHGKNLAAMAAALTDLEARLAASCEREAETAKDRDTVSLGYLHVVQQRNTARAETAGLRGEVEALRAMLATRDEIYAAAVHCRAALTVTPRLSLAIDVAAGRTYVTERA